MKIITLTTILSLFICFCSQAQDLEIDTLLNNGIKDNRINFAFANVNHASATAYTDKSEFIFDLGDILARFDTTSPLRKNGFSHYSNFFNIYSVWFNDPFIFEAIPSYYQQSQAVIDDLFLPWADNEHGWVTMMYSLKGGGGGGAGRRDDLRRGDALIWGLDWETILHEFNHTMTGVGDEYTASGVWSNFICGEGANQTPALTVDEVPWRKWIVEGTPIPTPYSEEYFGKIGAFEGTIAGYFGCQRPTAQSCYMGAGGFGDGFGQDMCSVCLQRFVCRLYQFVDAIENEFPQEENINVNTDETISFSVNTVKPIPNTQQYKWLLNGQIIATGVETIDITFGDCESYELTFEMTDSTDFVRYDEDYAYLYPEPKQSHTWTIKNENASASDLEASVTGINADCTGKDTGKILIDAIGGEAPYTYIINGVEYNSNIENLAAGLYQVIILDSKGCQIIRNIEIGQDIKVDFNLVTEFNDGVWKIYPLFDETIDASNFLYSWSDGSVNPEIYVTETGIYAVDVTISSSCSNSKEVEIIDTPCAGLEVNHDVVYPSDLYNGAIYLDINNGIAPFSIFWSEYYPEDLTMNDPTVSFSSGNDQNPKHLTRYLFDDIVQFDIDFWAEGFTGMNFAGYDFGEPTGIDYYSLTSNVDVQGRDAKNWTLQGSNDYENWDIIDTRVDITFENRLEKKVFLLNEEVNFRYYRIFITENCGDGWIAIQEMEFGSRKNTKEIKTSRDEPYLTNIPAGTYNYTVIDANSNIVSDKLNLPAGSGSLTTQIIISKEGTDKVKIENPLNGMQYYWYEDVKTQILLHKGVTFQPLATANYYVRAVNKGPQVYASESKGFAVTLKASPEVDSDNGTFTITNPDSNAKYLWYNTLIGGEVLHTGTSFTVSEMGDYYVSTSLTQDEESAIDPTSIGGITLWADASDIDGDGQLDEGLKNSSAYLWKFRENGGWSDGGWHAYRSNYSNGLGVVELGTVWFQYVNNNPAQMRSFVIAYEENGFSREGSAPFYGLKNYMGRNENQNQLFFENISNATKNGIVYLNGQAVNPEATYNSYNMKSLSIVLDQDQSLNLFACDEYWEGKIGEFIVFDRVLLEEELKGLHEYLRKKWLSTADLDSPRTKVSWKEDNIIYESSEEVSLCYGENYLGLSDAGTYIRTMKTCEGYDSIVTTVISVSELDPNSPPTINVSGGNLSVDFSGGTYQWYFNGVIIDGAINQDFQATMNGSYYCIIVDEFACTIETETINVVLSNTIDNSSLKMNLYPNPAKDFITIEKDLTGAINYTITDATGQVMKENTLNARVTVIDISNFNKGIYLITIGNSAALQSHKVVKL